MTWARGVAAMALAVAACTARDTIATSGDSGDDLAAFCAADGPPVLVDGTCTGELAEKLFRHAVCGCGSLAFSGDLLTDGFDSGMAPYTPLGVGGHVGSNVGIDGSQSMTIRGDLTAGSDGVEAGTMMEVSGDLASGGPLGRSGSTIRVGGSARVAGDVTVASLTVGGTLVTRPGATVRDEIIAAVMESADVTVPPPCRCEEAIDVAALIEQHAVVNHDAEGGVAPDALHDVDGDATLELDCGRYYLDDIGGNTDGTVVIRSNGRTALFVAGNITLRQNLVVELAADAELDLFIGGYIQVSGVTTLGDRERPSALRIYVAVGGTISLSAGSSLSGNLHAPLADLASPVPLEVFGSLVVNRVNGAAAVTVHHDRAIGFAGQTCAD